MFASLCSDNKPIRLPATMIPVKPYMSPDWFAVSCDDASLHVSGEIDLTGGKRPHRPGVIRPHRKAGVKAGREMGENLKNVTRILSNDALQSSDVFIAEIAGLSHILEVTARLAVLRDLQCALEVRVRLIGLTFQAGDFRIGCHARDHPLPSPAVILAGMPFAAYQQVQWFADVPGRMCGFNSGFMLH